MQRFAISLILLSKNLCHSKKLERFGRKAFQGRPPNKPLTFLTTVDVDDRLDGVHDTHEGDHDADHVNTGSRHVHHESVHQDIFARPDGDLHRSLHTVRDTVATREGSYGDVGHSKEHHYEFLGSSSATHPVYVCFKRQYKAASTRLYSMSIQIRLPIIVCHRPRTTESYRLSRNTLAPRNQLVSENSKVHECSLLLLKLYPYKKVAKKPHTHKRAALF